MKLECHGEVRGNTLRLILYHSRQDIGLIILRKEDLGDTMCVLFSNSSKEMTVSGAESCGGVHDTSNAWAIAIVGNEA